MSARLRRRIGRPLALAAITFIGLTCRDRSPLGPGLPVPARYDLAPRFQVARSGPSIRLDAVRATLTPYPTGDGTPVLDTVAHFSPTSEELRIDLAMSTDPAQRYVLRLAATDASGDTVYRAADTVRLVVTTGTPPAPTPITLSYAGADTIVASVAVAPRDTLFAVGDSVPLRAVAYRADQTVVTGARFGYAVSDSAVASVSPTGVLRATAAFAGVWVYAGTANGAVDSTRVAAFMRVARVAVTPRMPTLPQGDTLLLSATAFDVNAVPLTGRTIAWATPDTGLALDAATGRVIARAATGTARVVATAEGRADTAVVTFVPQKVRSVTLQADTVALARGDSLQMTATLRDRHGNVLTGRTIAWSHTDAAVATVGATGMVTAVAGTGTARVIAAVDTTGGVVADTVVVRALPRPVATVTASSDSVELVLGQTGVLTATARDAQGAINGDWPNAWTSLDTNVVRVTTTADGGGALLARAIGATAVIVTTGGVSDTVLVRVRASVTELVISPSADTLFIAALGDTLRLTAQAYDNGTATNAAVTWSTRAAGVATVDTAGLVTGVAQGSAWIVAVEPQSGLRDSALVTVRQQVASVTVTAPVTSMNALGRRAPFTATPLDARGNVVPGRTAAWSTSASAVAALDSINGNSTQVVATGNGTATIGATFDGVTGSATLTVTQQLVTIVVTPTRLDLGAGQTALALAEGRDDNGYAMQAQPPVDWTTDDAAVATVSPTGVVTGVSTGTAHVRASSGGVVSNDVLVNVLAMAIRFEADTLAVGSRTQTTIALRLTGVPATDVVVGFEIRDTSVAKLSSTATYGQVRFAHGTTTQYVSVVGYQLGATAMTAWQADDRLCDGPCGPMTNPPYAPDTTTLRTVSGMALEMPVEVASGDSAFAQLALQTPAPTGGLQVTFQYDVAGIARVLPETLTVPAGHLAADVVIETQGEGAVRITPVPLTQPSPPGLVATLNVGPPRLQLFGNDSLGTAAIIGAGQREEPAFAWLQAPPSVDLRLATATTSGFAETPAEAIVPAGQHGSAVRVGGLAPGVDTLTATAPLYGTARLPVRVTTPHLLVGDAGDTLLVVGNGAQSVPVSVADSLLEQHPRASALDVTVTSSDTSVLEVDRSVVRIEAGSSASWDLMVTPLAAGAAELTVSAPGHVPATLKVQVIAPKLRLGPQYDYDDTTKALTLRVGEMPASGERGYAVTRPTYGAPATVSLRHTNPDVSQGDSLVLLAEWTSSATVGQVRGVAVGRDTVIATAPGHEPDTLVIDVVPGRFGLASPRDTLQVGELAYSPVGTRSGDYVWGSATVTVKSSDPAVLQADTVLVLDGGQTQSSGAVELRAIGVGTALVTVSAPGAEDTTYTVVVRGRKLLATAYQRELGNGDTTYVGVGQLTSYLGSPAITVSVPNPQPGDVTVVVSTPDAGILELPTTTLLLTANNGFTNGVAARGLSSGTARVIFTGETPGYEPDTVWVTVAAPVVADYHGNTLPERAKAGAAPVLLQLAAGDSVTAPFAQWYGTVSAHDPADTVALVVTSSNPEVLAADSAVVHLGPGAPVSAEIPVRFLGNGTATLTVRDSLDRWQPYTRTVTVEAPRLTFDRWGYTQGRATLGMRQRFGTYDGAPSVCTTGPTASPVIVDYATSDPAIATPILATDTIPATTSSWGACINVDVAAHDTLGTVAITARARDGLWVPDTLRLTVGRPRLVVTSVQETAYLGSTGETADFAVADQNGNVRINLDTLYLEAASSNVDAIGVTSPSPLVVPAEGGTSILVDYRAVAPGTARVRLRDPRAGSALFAYMPGETVDVTAASGALALRAPYGAAPTARQLNMGYEVSLPYTPADSIWVRLASSAPEAPISADSVLLSPATAYGYFDLTGAAVGASTTLSASGAGVGPASTTLSFQRGRLWLSGPPMGLYPGDSATVTLWVYDGNQRQTQTVTEPQTLTVTVPDGLAVTDAGTGLRTTTLTIPAGADGVTFYVVALKPGTFSLGFSGTNYRATTSSAFTVY